MNWHVELGTCVGSLELSVEMTGGKSPVVLVGPNGSGKTTLLRAVAGVHRPQVGEIRVGGRVLLDTASGVDLAPEHRRVGYVPQGYGLFPHLTVLENVAFGSIQTCTEAVRHQRAMALLEEMECALLADRRPGALSGGEQQKVALARALMIDPAILLLDEPLAALDAPARRRLRGYLAAYLADRGRPAIVVTHDVRDVLALGATVYVVEEGRIVQHGSAEQLAASPATDFVAEFFYMETSDR